MSQVTNKKHFQSLDAFRGIAAVMIILYHSQFYSDAIPNQFVRNSHIFVDFFFILSGFVIAYSYLNRISEGISFSKFMILRFARLYPLHLFTLLLWVPYIGIKIYLYQLGIGATDPYSENNLTGFIENLLLLQGFTTISWNYPSWSISVEFFTYLLFFIVFFFLRNRSFSLKLFVIIAILTLTFLTKDSIDFLHHYLNCINEFFLGVFVYYLYKKSTHPSLSFYLSSLLEILTLAMVAFTIYAMHSSKLFFYATIFSFVLTLYIFSVQHKGIISLLLQRSFFQHLGKISYSIYLMHAIVVSGTYNVLTTLFPMQKGGVNGIPDGVIYPYTLFLDIVLIAVVIILSGFTYKYVETAGQRFIKKRFIKDAA